AGDRRARNGGSSTCASGTGRDHKSYSECLPDPILARSSLFLIVRTPALLADCFSGVRIGEERWNVHWKAVTGALRVSCESPNSVKSIFELFLRLLYAFRRSTPGFRLSVRPAEPLLSAISASP